MAKVAIEAVKGLNTINEIAAHFEVAPTQKKGRADIMINADND